MNTYFVTGIGTEVGKTIVSAILTQSLNADYWKPIQAGELENSDTHKVQQLVTNANTVFHPNAYALQHPESPHSAAKKEGISITLTNLKEPKTKSNLIIEGAGGVLVPLNEKGNTMLDLIKPTHKVILVSKHYLGSINHTLLTIQALKNKGIKKLGIIFNGNQDKETEQIIVKNTHITIIGRVNKEPHINAQVINKYANQFQSNLLNL